MAQFLIGELKLTYKTKEKATKQVTTSLETNKLIREFDIFPEDEIEYRERFAVLYFNRRNKCLGWSILSEGGTSAIVVDNKILFQYLLMSNASAFVMVHNHPSGGLIPSIGDDTLTKNVGIISKAMDLTLLDLLIVTKHDYYSYRDEDKI